MVLTVEAKEWNPPTGAPTISGNVESGETLTVDTSDIRDADGLTGAAFAYQWVSSDGGSHTDIWGATEPSYTLSAADEGKVLWVWVTYTDDAGYEESLTSVPISSKRPFGLTATAVDGTVVLRWKLSAGVPRDSYHQILRNRPELGEAEPLVHVKYTPTAGIGFIDTDVEPGVLYEYRVKWADSFGFTYEASDPVEVRTPVSAPVENPPASDTPTTGGETQPGEMLSAEFLDAPAYHDGQNSFTFELRFSEEPGPGFSYRTLRDHAFAVTGGTVTKARRLERPSNVRWEITITPSSDAAVSIVLPETTDCEADGAVCNGSGTMLSGELTLTVAGPL